MDQVTVRPDGQGAVHRAPLPSVQLDAHDVGRVGGHVRPPEYTATSAGIGVAHLARPRPALANVQAAPTTAGAGLNRTGTGRARTSGGVRCLHLGPQDAQQAGDQGHQTVPVRQGWPRPGWITAPNTGGPGGGGGGRSSAMQSINSARRAA